MTDAATPRPDLPTHYAPAEVEGPLYARWEERGYFIADPTSQKPPFSIVIPPPNVTGNLHLGHALQHSMMDALTRRARMRGFDVLWLPGMDHASIGVHTLVERYLAETEGKGRFDYSRDEFVAKVWEWKERFGGQILGQMRRLGDGVDWTRERFTLDEGLSRAVQTIFKSLYDNELIYRAERIINWCPRDLTALSDAEVDHVDEPGELISIRYGDGDGAIVVATTRAETMLGDTAVAVHPDDERYQHLIGTEVALAADQPDDPDHRRRTRRPVLRHRRGEGHPGARPERLRDRPAAQPADADDHERARGDHRARAVRRSRPAGGSLRDRRRAARGRADRRGEAPVHPLGGALLEVRRHDRTTGVAAVVGARRAAGQGGR